MQHAERRDSHLEIDPFWQTQPMQCCKGLGDGKARSTLATMSKQRSTLSKGRNFNAKLVRHCCRFWQQSRTLLRHCCKNGNNVEATFDIVAFDNVASTLLLVWTRLNDAIDRREAPQR